jgi:putative sugar O-methyltransferase
MTTWSDRVRFAVENPKAAIIGASRQFALRVPPVGWVMRLFEGRQTRLFHQTERLALAGKFAEAARAYKAAIAVNPERSAMYAIGVKFAERGRLGDDFYTALINQIETQEIREMFEHLARCPELLQPSHFWLYFMTYNALQIETGGIEQFKRTVNNNYFNWTASPNVAEQLDAVAGVSGTQARARSGSDRYSQFLLALYEFTKRHDKLGLLDVLTEPELGNPIVVESGGVRVSQDLCNTTLDLNTIVTKSERTRESTFTLYELGSGCGRIGYGLMRGFPNARYVAIDIPPALYVAQWYLGKLFPDVPIFRFRQFSTYEQIRAEFEKSRVAFLSPDQAALLPNKSCDIFINICSLQEMTRDHVDYWFGQIDRLCNGTFYSKQFKEHYNPVDRFSLNEGDYPVRQSWQTVMRRENPTFPSLFEAVYKI